jgi:GH15 family glucan-1,4-alpha-glucosidase
MYAFAKDITRIFLRRMLNPTAKIHRKGDTLEEISKKVLDECFFEGFFHVSPNNFRSFFVRDFAIVAKPLSDLGYKEQVHSTIRFALRHFMKAGRITTTISKDIIGYRCYNLPFHGIDSYALILKAIDDSGYEMSREERRFLLVQIRWMRDNLLDKEGLPMKKKYFSSIRDQAIKKSSCYNVAMLGYINLFFEHNKMRSPLRKFDYKKMLLEKYWNGEFYHDDIDHKGIFCSDSNIFPFWLGIDTAESRFEKVMKQIIDKNLDLPYVLKYNTKEDAKKLRFTRWRFIFPNYETYTIWTHLGIVYLQALVMMGKKEAAKEHVDRMVGFIEKHGNIVEVLAPDGRPYRSLFYLADESLSWIAGVWQLHRELKPDTETEKQS